MDIDIDVNPGFKLKEVFPQAVQASMVQNGELKQHPVGAYLENMPADPCTGLAAIPYAEAEELGFFKVDFLHLNVYKEFKDREEIMLALRSRVNWDLLLQPSVQVQLFQLAKHGALLDQVQPKDLATLADVMALIRPSCAHLVEEYLQDRASTRVKLYARRKGDSYAFKKSHALAYAMVVQLQLYLLSKT